MANEIQYGHISGVTLTYGVYQPDGTVRTAAGTSLPEISSTGYYTADDGNVIAGDMIVVNDTVGVIAQGIFEPDVVLASTGLDSISIAEPSGRATNFREQMVQLYMRFFNKVSKTSSAIKTHDASDVEVTSQTYTEGVIDIVNKAS